MSTVQRGFLRARGMKQLTPDLVNPLPIPADSLYITADGNISYTTLEGDVLDNVPVFAGMYLIVGVTHLRAASAGVLVYGMYE